MPKSGIFNPQTGKNFEKAEEAVKSFTKGISEFIKSVDIASDAFDASSNKAKVFAKEIQSAISEGYNPEEIASDLVGQLQDKLESEGKNITIPNLVKKLSELQVGKEVTQSIQEWAKQRNQYVIGVKSLAEELSNQLIKPFEYLTSWIEKIPGGKILSKMFGFDSIKKKIQTDITEKLAEATAKGGASLTTLKEIGISSFKSIGGAAKALFANIYLLGIAALIAGLYVAYKQWNKLIDAAKSLRDETGLTADQSIRLTRSTNDIAESYGSMGVDVATLSKSNAALVNEFQTTAAITHDMAENAGIMVGALGVAPEIAAKTLRVFRNIGNLTDEMSGNLMASVANIARLGGVAPAKVFQDIAESSSEIYLYFKGNLLSAMKTAIELRRMGTSLKEAANTSKNLLDFETSITNTLEASVLAGTQLDFSRARYLAFTGKLKDSQDAILDQIQRIHGFENMNVIQKEAIAKASGMELGTLENMLQQRKVLAGMNLKERAAYESSLQALKNFRDANKANLTADNQRLLLQEKLAKAWDNIVYIASSVLFPVFNAIYDVIDNITKQVQTMLASDKGKEMMESLKKIFTEIGDIIIKLIPVLSWVAGVIFPQLIKYVEAFIEPFKIGIEIISKLIEGDFSGALNMIPELIFSVFKRAYFMLTWPFRMLLSFVDEIFGTKLVNALDGVINIAAGVMSTVYDILTSPFTAAIALITGGFDGLGKYIKSWWNVIYDNVIKPLMSAWNFISGIFSGDNNTNKGPNAAIAPATATGGVVTKPQVRTVGEAGPEAIVPLNQIDNFGNSTKVVNKLDELIDKMTTPDIVGRLDTLIKIIQSLDINMDSKKVGEIIATNTPHPGMG